MFHSNQGAIIHQADIVMKLKVSVHKQLAYAKSLCADIFNLIIDDGV
jgi:hypothetical protein